MTALLHIVIAALLAQAPAGPPPAIARPLDQGAEQVQVTAVRAAMEGRAERVVDAELKNLEKLFEKFPFDTFSLEAQREFEAPHGGPTTVPLNDVYALEVMPHRRLESGEVELDARIVSLAGDAPVGALITRAKAAPGQALIFRGMPLDDGELIVIMNFGRQDGDQGGQSSSDAEEDESEEQEQPPQFQEQDESDADQEDSSENDADAQPRETETKSMADEDVPSDKELQNLEALLQSLEEQDQRERRELLNRQDWMEMRKDWW